MRVVLEGLNKQETRLDYHKKLEHKMAESQNWDQDDVEAIFYNFQESIMKAAEIVHDKKVKRGEWRSGFGGMKR